MRISEKFKLKCKQPELDFVDIIIDNDTPLFIDPYVFRFRDDPFSIECNNLIVDFFEQVLRLIQSKDTRLAEILLNSLGEPEETHLGVSEDSIQGRGVGRKQARQILDSLKNSEAARTGLLRDLSDCQLMIRGISYDKISDMATNIIREKLIEYTQEQCKLYSIPVKQKPSGGLWKPELKRWISGVYTDLPCINENPVLLVPKNLVVYTPTINDKDFFNNEIVDFIRSYHLNLNDALVQVLKNGKKRVTKKDIEAQPEYKMNKEFIFDFCQKHPDVFAAYKERKGKTAKNPEDISDLNEEYLAKILKHKLESIKPGSTTASDFHNFCIGVLEFIFYPHWVYPRKETEIHEGRKRIDITFNNGAKGGFFFDMKVSEKIAAQTLMIECKNYTHDMANPELDQISGRLSNRRGWLGIIIGRGFEDRERFFNRCRDTALDDRGIILPFVDTDIVAMLNMIAQDDRKSIDRYIYDIYSKVVN